MVRFELLLSSMNDMYSASSDEADVSEEESDASSVEEELNEDSSTEESEDNQHIPPSSFTSITEPNFVVKPSEDFSCPITFELLREPYQTRCCGKHLCKKATAMLQKKGKPCPLCNKKKLKTVLDKFFKRQVMELKVYCSHKSDGCEWVGELGCLEGHLNASSIEGECRFEEIACSYSCQQKIKRHEIAAHQQDECPQRPFRCQYCEHNSTYSEITTKHYSQCQQYPLECPNECGEPPVKRCKVSSHLEQCPLQVLTCDFAHAGCTAMIQRAKMTEHNSQNMEAHLSMTSQVLKEQSTTLQQQETTLQQQETTLQQQLSTIATLQQQIKQLISYLNPEALAKVPSFVFIPPPSFVVTDFLKRRCGIASSKCYSPPFYSHIQGYKMCLRVDVNGWGSGEGSHVSVSFYLMRGEYDDNLPWPFQGDITVQLVNQKRNISHREVTICFDEDVRNEISGRVMERERAMCGKGYPTFISHNVLNCNAVTNIQYIKNDSLEFRVVNIELKTLV